MGWEAATAPLGFSGLKGQRGAWAPLREIRFGLGIMFRAALVAGLALVAEQPRRLSAATAAAGPPWLPGWPS